MVQYVAIVSCVVRRGFAPAPVASGDMRKRKNCSWHKQWLRPVARQTLLRPHTGVCVWAFQCVWSGAATVIKNGSFYALRDITSLVFKCDVPTSPSLHANPPPHLISCSSLESFQWKGLLLNSHNLQCFLERIWLFDNSHILSIIIIISNLVAISIQLIQCCRANSMAITNSNLYILPIKHNRQVH